MGYNETSWPPGEDNPNATMTNAEARAARYLRRDFEMTLDELARMYGVARSTMSILLRGITFKHAGGPIDPGRKPPDRSKPGPRSQYYRRPTNLGSGIPKRKGTT
jgi:hypothetical protein